MTLIECNVDPSFGLDESYYVVFGDTLYIEFLNPMNHPVCSDYSITIDYLTVDGVNYSEWGYASVDSYGLLV